MAPLRPAKTDQNSGGGWPYPQADFWSAYRWPRLPKTWRFVPSPANAARPLSGSKLHHSILARSSALGSRSVIRSPRERFQTSVISGAKPRSSGYLCSTAMNAVTRRRSCAMQASHMRSKRPSPIPVLDAPHHIRADRVTALPLQEPLPLHPVRRQDPSSPTPSVRLRVGTGYRSVAQSFWAGSNFSGTLRAGGLRTLKSRYVCS
jgi:hypothetical protein